MGYFKKIFASTVIGALCLPMLVMPVYAQVDTYLDDIGTSAGLSDNSLEDTIGSLINIILTFLGIVLLVLVIYAGFLWMTAGGDAEQTKKAKDYMINAVIGLIIVLAAYAISSFVITALQEAQIAS
ncbi:pilin [Candidatus Parcubacteria bacterium]|nr:pilin [Patescibacteria group bacterium]MCG2687519.1 pilin [Candidatus Parcubacteria bacterium]